MVALKYSEMRILDDALDMHGGYVLNFSDRTFSEFFDDEFGIHIYDPKYSFNGSSKTKHMRAFIKVEDEYTVSRVLRRLWEHRESVPLYEDSENHAALKQRFFGLVTKIEGGGALARTDAIERFKPDETLEELVAAIERDIGANKPVAALDRLHTYCMKKFAHLLDERGIAWERSEPLHSRVGKYVRALGQEHELRDITAQIIRNAIGVFDKFNSVRNNQSLAHDNEILDHVEARFIYDSITAFLRFVKSLDLMHELAHLVLEHEPARVDMTAERLMILDTYNKTQEEEADWLAGALLVPREALLRYLANDSREDHAAAHFHVSRQMIAWRRQVTGVDIQLGRRSPRRGPNDAIPVVGHPPKET
jgi:IrrE N-terminal-like domain/Abortive infection C-terminus